MHLPLPRARGAGALTPAPRGMRMLPGWQQEGTRLVRCFAPRNPGMCQQLPQEAAPLKGGEELVLKG